MAHFLGTLQGSRGRASRLGTKASGLLTTAASWQGAVQVSLWHEGKTFAHPDGQDMARVELIPWRGAGVSRLLYEGPVRGDLSDLQNARYYGLTQRGGEGNER